MTSITRRPIATKTLHPELFLAGISPFHRQGNFTNDKFHRRTAVRCRNPNVRQSWLRAGYNSRDAFCARGCHRSLEVCVDRRRDTFQTAAGEARF